MSEGELRQLYSQRFRASLAQTCNDVLERVLQRTDDGMELALVVVLGMRRRFGVGLDFFDVNEMTDDAWLRENIGRSSQDDVPEGPWWSDNYRFFFTKNVVALAEAAAAGLDSSVSRAIAKANFDWMQPALEKVWPAQAVSQG